MGGLLALQAVLLAVDMADDCGHLGYMFHAPSCCGLCDQVANSQRCGEHVGGGFHFQCHQLLVRVVTSTAALMPNSGASYSLRARSQRPRNLHVSYSNLHVLTIH